MDVALPVDHALDTPHANLSAEQAAQSAVEWSALATCAIARAGAQQAAQANRCRADISFAAQDLVLLSLKHLPLQGTRKLQPRWMGPFRVLKSVGSVVYKLELPAYWSSVHPVFHASLLRP